MSTKHTSQTADEESVETIKFARDLEPKKAEAESDSPIKSKVSASLDLESMIRSHLQDIEKLKEQLKTQKDMYDSTFESDAVFSETAEKEKEAKKAAAAIKQKLVKQPAVVDIDSRMKTIKQELKEHQDMISSLVEQYEKLTGNDQIVQEDGEVLEIIKTYKLVKKRNEE